MRKQLALVLIFAIFVGTPTAFSATPKVGGACTKINQFHELKLTLLVCTTAKGKKTWRKATSTEKSLYLKEKKRLVKAAADAVTKVVPTPTPSLIPTPIPTPQFQINSLTGIQNQALPIEYVDAKPFASLIFRWPVISNSYIRAYVVKYQNKTSYIPKCDLAVALCAPAQLLDPNVYTIFIKDPSLTYIEVKKLEIDTDYAFSFYWVSGTTSNLAGLEDLNFPMSLNYFAHTSTERVPTAPQSVIVGTTPGNIKISATNLPTDGTKLSVFVIGGQFGIGKVAGILTGSGELLIPVSPGTYQVVTMLVTPSGVNGNPSDTSTVKVT